MQMNQLSPDPDDAGEKITPVGPEFIRIERQSKSLTRFETSVLQGDSDTCSKDGFPRIARDMSVDIETEVRWFLFRYNPRPYMFSYCVNPPVPLVTPEWHPFSLARARSGARSMNAECTHFQIRAYISLWSATYMESWWNNWSEWTWSWPEDRPTVRSYGRTGQATCSQW